MAIQNVPDIELSDILMPVTDGIDLLRRIKNDIRIRHLFLLIVNAGSGITSKLSGFEKNAEACLVIEFDGTDLQAILENLSGLNQILHVSCASVKDDKFKGQAIKSPGDQFIQKVIHLMDSNLDNDQFGVADLCDAIGMSRAQFYRKFKSLIGKTPHDYLKAYRLQKAKQFLLTTDFNVSEVAYRTGFKNISHFSRVFSTMFGKSPSEFIR